MAISEVIEELEARVGRERAYARALHEKMLREERRRQSGPGGLLHFIRYFWHEVEPKREFVEGWALRAMCSHLEAVDEGLITNLLITVPPGSMKSLLCSVFFPLWQWSARAKPWMRYVTFSYAAHLTQRDNERFIKIIKSPRFQELWGRSFKLTADGKEKPANDQTGWKFASSVGGVGTGERGDGVILDDPHNIKDDKSEVVRPETVRWFKEAMSNRLNDMDKSWIIAIMQRSHEADVAGTIIDEDHGYVHLNLPMEFEVDHRCITYDNNGNEFWRDPREYEGQVMWPERFSPAAIKKAKKLGEHVWVSQYQQRPEPRGGGLFKREYWQPYIPKKNAKGLPMWPASEEYIIASLDGAFTEDTENDPNGFTIWSVFQNDEGSWCVLLKHAWRRWLRLNGRVRPKKPMESWSDYRAETESDWGLIQWLRHDCTRFRVDNLLIENKANGHDVYSEMLNHAEFDKWTLTHIDPKNLDKWARGLRIQPIYTDGLVYAVCNSAGEWTPASKLVIDEMASFPRAKYRDLTDTATQVLWYLRKNGFLEHHDTAKERQLREAKRAGKKPTGAKPLYPA